MSGNCAELKPSEKAFNYLRETGETIKDAAETIGKSKSTGQRIANKTKVLQLSAPSTINSAVRTIKNMAAGRPARSGQDAPPPSVTLAAAKEITDRAEPKVNLNQNLNLNVSISPVDLSKYKD